MAAFAAGLTDDQHNYRIVLADGDTSSTTGPVVIAITVFGEVLVGGIMRRGNARAGDGVFATGTIGDAALGLGGCPAPCLIPPQVPSCWIAAICRSPV